MPTDAFLFDGFLPRGGARLDRIRELVGMGMTVIAYESPHRIEETLGDIASVLGDQPICAASILAELKGTERMRGEFALVLPALAKETTKEEGWIEPMVLSLIAEGVHTKTIAAALAAATGWPKKEAYAFVLKKSGTIKS
jgi:16S rRNA (cytidine1402-2'-O)-methyltransferase